MNILELTELLEEEPTDTPVAAFITTPKALMAIVPELTDEVAEEATHILHELLSDAIPLRLMVFAIQQAASEAQFLLTREAQNTLADLAEASVCYWLQAHDNEDETEDEINLEDEEVRDMSLHNPKALH